VGQDATAAAEKEWEKLVKNPPIWELYRHDKNRRRVDSIRRKVVLCAVAPIARSGFALLRENGTYAEKQ